MTVGLIGRKIGMTRVFTGDGDSVPVTVVDVSDNRVTQIKTLGVDGYSAVQVGFGVRRATRVTRAQKGHFAKAGVGAAERLKEFSVSADDLVKYQVSSVVALDIFAVGQFVDVTGVSQGKGYAGVIKRHHFRSNRATHGNSRSHNTPGSIGMRQDPGRVFPGKRMSGHLGAVKRTIQRLQVVRVDAERGLLLIKGSIPGSKGGSIVVRHSVKAGI
ncbi:MAG: 50S ribosomal protein L3 [Pseudomonadota bacterium]